MLLGCAMAWRSESGFRKEETTIPGLASLCKKRLLACAWQLDLTIFSQTKPLTHKMGIAASVSESPFCIKPEPSQTRIGLLPCQDCSEQVAGFPGARFKGFHSEQEGTCDRLVRSRAAQNITVPEPQPESRGRVHCATREAPPPPLPPKSDLTFFS